jgi:hypothetical protein
MDILNTLKEFALGTSIHGLKFIAQSKLSTLKRTIWAFIFIGAMVYAVQEIRNAANCKIFFTNVLNTQYTVKSRAVNWSTMLYF